MLLAPQGRDLLWLEMVRGSFPGIHELDLMHVDPGSDTQQLGPWQVTSQHRPIFDGYGGPVSLSVPHVNMRGSVVLELDFYEKTEKST